jgi:2-iminobutanoate/2-iminopropanoate deaminase
VAEAISAVRSGAAPAPIGPYNQAVRAGGFIFCSGQIAIDAATGDLVEADAAGQARVAMSNLAAVLAAAGSSLDDVVKTTIFLVDMADFPSVNAAYGEHFRATPPARSTVAVAALPRGARVEIEAVALAR